MEKPKNREIFWTEFYNEILLQYEPDDLDDPMVDLANLKQSGSVQEYYKLFIRLAHLVDETEKNLINLFLAELREDLRVKVKITMSVTMVSTYRSACAQEIITVAKKNLEKGSSVKFNHTVAGQGIPSEKFFPNKDPSTCLKGPVKRLTLDQVEDYRKRGLCFKYDEKFTPGHRRSVERLMMIEIDYSKEEDEEIIFESKGNQDKQEAEISIHAMEGNCSSHTITLMGHINSKPVSILLDTGSTHNFIDPKLVQRAGLVLSHEPSFKVTIAGDDQLYNASICKSILIRCQSMNIMINSYVLPIGGIKWF